MCARPALALLVALVLVASGGGDARADSSATWRLAPAQPPPPPVGVAPAPYAVPLGTVGDLSFWAPDRGLLITGGAGPVSAGLYAYDGSSWHQLSTVCGGARGRIAWAGPDEFWTISDQRSGQILPPGNGNHSLQSLSLCHFFDGQVVGSYAMPLAQPDSYLPMDAAACYGPSDCWFGGPDGQGPGAGAFHLHWDGSGMTAVFEPEDHAVTDMVDFAGQLYESVGIGAGDSYLPEEDQLHPAVIHTIAPGGQTSLCDEVVSSFCELFIFTEDPPPGRKLPAYGKGVAPFQLQGFSLGTDGPPTGVGATQLWAAASPIEAPAQLTVLRFAEGAWSQILPDVEGGSSLSGQMLAGGNGSGTSSAVAPEPGSHSAWLSLRSEGRIGAEIAELNADGTLAQPPESLPGSWEPEPVGYRGNAGPIACPAPHDCWMVTSLGWLFHLSDGSLQPRSDDPFFDGEDGVISYRPPDSGVPAIYPDAPPVDDSLANQQPAPAPSGPLPQTPAPPVKHVRGKPLLAHVQSRLLHHSVLVVSFTLTARAHVQLLGRRKRKVVASTRKKSLKPGRHRLSLRLDPARWPTEVQFKATPIGVAAPGGGSGGSESSDTIGT